LYPAFSAPLAISFTILLVGISKDIQPHNLSHQSAFSIKR